MEHYLILSDQDMVYSNEDSDDKNGDSDDKNAENEDSKDDKNKNAKYLMDDDDDEEILKQKKLSDKCRCKKEIKEKNFPYHLLSEHKIIPEKQKES